MRMLRILPILVVVGAPLAACDDDQTSTTETASTQTTTASPSTSAATTVAPTSSPTTSAAPTTAGQPTTSAATPNSTAPTGDLTPGLWPPDGAVSPEAAAAAFVSFVFRVEPLLGEFRAGDARSGEIDVLGPEAGGGVRSTVFVRRLGADDAWYVIGAASEGVEITAPETGATVPAGPLDVAGLGRGFESTINVLAVTTELPSDGDGAAVIASAIGAGGPFGTLEPFDVTLDLSDVQPGDTLTLVARGDTGLGGDTGEFTAIAITVE